ASSGIAVAQSDKLLESAVLKVLGIVDPVTTDHRMIYAIMLSWTAALSAVLNDRLRRSEFEEVLRLSITQLIKVRSNRAASCSVGRVRGAPHLSSVTMGAGERKVMPDLSNMNGFVTAAGSGIGRASAIAFARAGAKVLVTDIVAEAVEETCEAIRAEGGTAEGRIVDASSEDD